jgi:hypothetical protein
MERDQVIDAVDGEREYQNDQAAAGTGHVVPDISLGDTISAMQFNLNRARDAWYNGRYPHEAAMAYMRKLAALAVQAGEKYGMPRREGY